MDDQQCLDRIRTGGQPRIQGISELYRKYARQFLGYMMKHRVPREHAEELVQDVFVSVVRKCDDFRGDTRIDAWLWAIVRNGLVDYFRRARPEESTDDDTLIELAGGVADPEVETGTRLQECVQNAFSAFSRSFPERAKVLSLVVNDEWGMAEIAAMLGRTPGAAREYVSQCRKKLRKFLEPCREFLAG